MPYTEGQGRKIIIPVGLSYKNGLKNAGLEVPRKKEMGRLTNNVLEGLGEKKFYISAEMTTLKGLKTGDGDEAVFLATDTQDGIHAGEINARIAEIAFDIPAKSVTVDSLTLDDEFVFRTKGIPKMISILDGEVDDSFTRGLVPVLSVSGGIKAPLPYIGVYAMMRGLRFTYVFERTHKLIDLWPLPIQLDWDRLQEVQPALNKIEAETVISQEKLHDMLGSSYSGFEGLFEFWDKDQVGLSAFGFMVLRDIKQAKQDIFIFDDAQKKLESMHEVEREYTERYLERVRNPVWRKQHRHGFHRSKLTVYKPGNTGFRLAGWEDDKGVYIAEIFPCHDQYERVLTGRSQNDYELARFSKYQPSTEDLSSCKSSPEQELIDKLRAKNVDLEEQNNTLKSEIDEAFETAAEEERKLRSTMKKTEKESETKIEKLRMENKELRQKLNEAESGLETLREKTLDMSRWSFLKRIKWAISGGPT